MLENFGENVTQYLISGSEDYLENIETELQDMDINTIAMFAAMLEVVHDITSYDVALRRIKRLQNLYKI